jgi:hypothetical protein
MNSLCSIFQIYYDQKSFDKLDRGFTPLDNSNNNSDGWFEFKPILNYLNNHPLDDNIWYGFLSPSFHSKTGVTSGNIFQIIEHHHQFADVALLHTGWDQICYFKNPWEQGEVWHPGLKAMSQDFFNKMDFDIDTDNLVTDLTSSVFSNYVIAKKQYWIEWKYIANKFFSYIKENEENLDVTLTSYGNKNNQYPIKTFVQERFASLILKPNKFKVIAIDQSFGSSVYKRIFQDSEQTKELLRKCDFLKNQYRTTSNPQFLKDYYVMRSKIKFTAPVL